MVNLKMKSGIRYVAVGLALTTLSGCPNSIFNPSSKNPGLSLGGKLIDGYVQNATVTLDINDDRICSATEPTTTTNAAGNFTFTGAQNIDGGQHMTCARGGTDLSTGLPLVGELLAPPGVTQITPLNSVIMAQINSTLPAPVLGVASAASSTSVNAAATTIGASLGLSAADLLTADPMTSSNPALLQANVAVQVLMAQTAAIVASATGAPDSQHDAIFQNAMGSIASALAATTGTPVSLSATLAGITNSVVSSTVTSTQADLFDAVAANVAAGIIDTALAAASAKAVTLAPASVAAFVGTSLSNLVNTVATATNLATNTGAANPANAAQSTVELANAADMVSTLLTYSVASANSGTGSTLLANLATLGNSVVTSLQATTNLASATTAASTINSALTQFDVAVVIPPANIVAPVTAATALASTYLQDVVPISSVVVSGTTATPNANGLLTVSTPGITNATLNLGLATPTTYAFPASADIAFKVVGGTRQFTLVIKGLTVTPNGSGAFTLTVPASGASLSADGVMAAGTTVNASVSQAILSTAITSTAGISGSTITVNIGSLLTALGKADPGFITLTSIKGAYTVTAVISNISLAVNPTVAASITTIAIPNTTYSVTGSSQSANVTVK